MSDIKDFNISKGFGDRWDLRYTGEDKDMVIPEELIANTGEDAVIAVSSENEIESLFIPKNISDIWLGTLYGASELKKITVDPENPYLKDIDGVLYTKDGKKLIKAPAQMTGKYVVPEGVEEVEMFAFQNSKFDEVVLPESLKKIDKSAFEYSAVKRIKVPKGVKEIDDSVFSECPELEEFEFMGDTSIDFGFFDPKTFVNGIVERISGEAFRKPAECYMIEYLKRFPDLEKYGIKFVIAAKLGKKEKILEYLLSVLPERKVEKGTFEINVLEDGSAELKSYTGEEALIEIPAEIDVKKLVSIGNGAFKGNEYIEKVVVPDGVTSIGKQAFYGCISLSEAVLAQSCVAIGVSAFEDCKSMEYINLPQGVTVLERKVFNNCVSLKELDLPDGLVKIDDEALRSCSSLEELGLPDGLKYLGKECLYGCAFNHGPELDGQWGYSKRKFRIPASVTQIDDGGYGLFASYAKAKELFGVFEYKIILQVKKGSIAHRYAAKKKIRFELV